jgi:hypothetical protein
MSKWMIVVPLVLVLAGCNGSVERDLAACRLEILHSRDPAPMQREHVYLCMQARGWRFTFTTDRCMDITERSPGAFESECYASDTWPWRRRVK